MEGPAHTGEGRGVVHWARVTDIVNGAILTVDCYFAAIGKAEVRTTFARILAER